MAPVRDLPNKRQHSAKVFAFGAGGGFHVEIGSPSNALGEPERAEGAIARARPDLPS